MIALSSGKMELDKIPAVIWVTPSILSAEKWTSIVNAKETPDYFLHG